jgi:[ribosomal protein S18]-alanine N-acetyltransferase
MSNIETAGLISEAPEYYLSPMTEHDLLEVVEIEESCGLSRWGWDAYYAELVRNKNAVMIVAHAQRPDSAVGERVIGFIAARLVGDELHINNVAVRPRHRRAGLGRELLTGALETGARLGAHTAFLEVRAGNVPAQALYARCGFRLTGRRPGYYTDPPEDAFVMSLSIRSSA